MANIAKPSDCVPSAALQLIKRSLMQFGVYFKECIENKEWNTVCCLIFFCGSFFFWLSASLLHSFSHTRVPFKYSAATASHRKVTSSSRQKTELLTSSTLKTFDI